VKIPFNRPHMTGKELWHVAQAHHNFALAGNGAFTKRCQAWLESGTGSIKALLTHSCTAALEMAALLANIGPGDEIILPSYTFVSTANAFVLRGAVPVFVDIRSDTLNLNEMLIEAAITPRTRAIVPVHYAGVGCEMDTIMAIAAEYDLIVIEDAAQGVMASYKGRPLGSIGHLGAYSFHETKNIICGEGGALLINRPEIVDLAEVIWEKGTDRSRFFRGQTDKYTWQHVGSSFLPGELVAAFLWAQIEEAQALTARRLSHWTRYHSGFAGMEQAGRLRRPFVPSECAHNGHMYYLILPSAETRDRLMHGLKELEINAIFHYVPLHSSPAGMRYGRWHGNMTVTDQVASCLLRLPMWNDLTEAMIDDVIAAVDSIL
jgi:dTDP-4-amino-4,6-dideoxygalactose transaminase